MRARRSRPFAACADTCARTLSDPYKVYVLNTNRQASVAHVHLRTSMSRQVTSRGVAWRGVASRGVASRGVASRRVVSHRITRHAQMQMRMRTRDVSRMPIFVRSRSAAEGGRASGQRRRLGGPGAFERGADGSETI